MTSATAPAVMAQRHARSAGCWFAMLLLLLLYGLASLQQATGEEGARHVGGACVGGGRGEQGPNAPLRTAAYSGLPLLNHLNPSASPPPSSHSVRVDGT